MRMTINWRKLIPWTMVGFRTALGPLLVIVALRVAVPEPWLGAMIAAGFISDVYDGILARRWGTATAALRIADSAADTVFYIGVLAAVVERHWPVIRDHIWWLAALLFCEALRWLFDWTKYRRMASYHSYAPMPPSCGARCWRQRPFPCSALIADSGWSRSLWRGVFFATLKD
jgi:phosphatidylglycerophosphate synthase